MVIPQGVAYAALAGMPLITGIYAALFPALIAVLRPPGEKQEVGTASMASVDHWILANRKLVLVLTGVVTVAGLPLLYWLPFDSNPMHLRSAKVESVATYLDLTKDPKTSPNTIDVVVPNRDAIAPMVKKLTALPSVAGVIDIDTFVPADQDQKLAIIEDAAQVMGPVLSPPRVAPAPSDREVVTAMAQMVAEVTGIPIDKITVVHPDTDVTPYGGGTWASRGAGVGGDVFIVGDPWNDGEGARADGMNIFVCGANAGCIKLLVFGTGAGAGELSAGLARPPAVRHRPGGPVGAPFGPGLRLANGLRFCRDCFAGAHGRGHLHGQGATGP